MAALIVPAFYAAGHPTGGDLQALADIMTLQMNEPSALVYQGVATTSLVSGTATALPFDTEAWDTDGMHSSVSNTDRLTVVTAGLYEILCGVGYAANATGYRWALPEVNGGQVGLLTMLAAPTIASSCQARALVQCAVGDYIQCFGRQLSGGALSTVAGARYTFLLAHRVSD